MVQEQNEDAIGTAVSFLLLGVAGGLGLDLCAKALLTDYSLEQFVFLRSSLGLGIFLLLARQFGGVKSLFTRRWPWHVLRMLFASGAMFGFFYGLSRMPLVDALTLGFTAPLMVTAMSAPALGEHVGWRRWTAVVIGFIGVLIILRPGSGEISLAAVAVLLAAFCYASLAITARKLATTESSYSLSVYAVVGPLLIASTMVSNSSWRAPDLNGWLLFLLAAGCSVIAWIGIIGGYRRAAPAVLAPLEYMALVGGAVAGYLIWDEVPDRWVVIGATTIIASGLFVVHREVGNTLSTRYLRALTAGAAAALRRRRT